MANPKKFPNEARYDTKMKSLGFRRCGPWAHDLDRADVIEYAAKKQKKRMKELKAEAKKFYNTVY